MLPIIDGDVLAHVCCKSRWLDRNGNRIVGLDQGNHSFTPEEDEEYLRKSWKEFEKMMESIMNITFSDTFLMAVKGANNYRDAIYSEYKANRRKDPSKVNNFVPTIRELAAHEYGAIVADGRETDDYLRIWALQSKAVNEPYVIVSVDKDLDCIPGKHYDPKKNIFYDVSELYATRFFYQQLMSGDPTDNIPGIPRLGPVKAEKFLYGLDDEADMQECVVEQYITAFGDEWYDQLLSNGKMVYLQAHENDFFSIAHWPVVQSLERPKIVVPPAADVLSHSEAIEEQLIPTPTPELRVAPAAKEVSSSPTSLQGMASSPSPKPFTGSVPKKE